MAVPEQSPLTTPEELPAAREAQEPTRWVVDLASHRVVRRRQELATPALANRRSSGPG